MKNNFEGNVMNCKLGFVCLCLFLFGITGCVGNRSYMEEECENGICTSNQEYRAVCTETSDGYSVCEEAPVVGNVNYTRTQADFRKYGERTPRDRRITQAGAGNNISAVVPPSINDEVLDYEEEVMSRNKKATRFATSNSDLKTQTQSFANSPEQPQLQPQNENDAALVTAYAQLGEEMPSQDEEETEEDNSEETEEEEDLNKDWLAEEGQSLKELLTQWSEESGWRLIWKTNRNYTLNAGAMFRGNFADVSSALIRAFARARPAPIATFYKGNRVLVIETMEDENAYD